MVCQNMNIEHRKWSSRLHCPPLIQLESKVTLAILTRKMKTYRKVVLTKVTLYYINSSNSTNCFIAFGTISTIIFKKLSQNCLLSLSRLHLSSILLYAWSLSVPLLLQNLSFMGQYLELRTRIFVLQHAPALKFLLSP